jgi:hypothetical protein
VNPGYDVLLVAHVGAAVVGFGAIGASGFEARAGRRSEDPGRDLGLRRFFRAGFDWAPRVIFLVPVLGLALLFAGMPGDVSLAYPWIGLGIWVAAAGLATATCWPAERRAQRALARLTDGVEAGALAEFRAACAAMERSVGLISLLFLAAVAVMIVQP